MEEIRSKDQKEETISRLLGSLPTAEAPENFEAMVRSQIADRRPAESSGRPVLWLALKFALPMLLLVFLGAFLIVSDDSSLDTGMVPPVDSSSVPSMDLDEKVPSNDVAVNSRNESGRPQPVNRNAEVPKTTPPSEVKALSQDDTTRFPPGVDPRNATKTNKRPSPGRISPISILSFIGITSACSPVSCQVRALQAGGLADRAGVRVGDVVEAIDQRPIDSTHLFSGEVAVRTLRIRRDGKQLTISLTVR
jgi:hypothetical protein